MTSALRTTLEAVHGGEAGFTVDRARISGRSYWAGRTEMMPLLDAHRRFAALNLLHDKARLALLDLGWPDCAVMSPGGALVSDGGRLKRFSTADAVWVFPRGHFDMLRSAGMTIGGSTRADEVRVFPKGRMEIVRAPGATIGRATYEPGWRWSSDVGRTSGQKMCGVEHIGLVISGRAAVAMDDGEFFEMSAGDLFHVPPGHDRWVIGDDPYVSIHFLGDDDCAC